MDILTRLISKIEVDDATGCWEWVGYRYANGYGMIKVKNRANGAHRIIYREMIGEIPPKIFVCHHCDNRGCVNPMHLFLGTNQDNIKDMCRKGRNARGDRHGSVTHPEALLRGDDHPSRKHPERMARGDRHGSKTHPEKVRRGDNCPASILTEEKVCDIINGVTVVGHTYQKMADKHGVTKTAVYSIIKGKTWKHVPRCV